MLDSALRLAPTSSDTRLAFGFYKYYVEGQRDSAMAYLEAARSLDKDNAALIAATATMLRASSRWDPALALSRRAVELDPHPRWVQELANTEAWMRRYEDADRDYRRAIRLRPDNVTPYFQLIWVQMMWKGDTAAVHSVLAEAEKHVPRLAIIRAILPRSRPALAMLDRSWQDELERRSLAEVGVPPEAYHLGKMELYRRRGQHARARAHADSAALVLEAIPADARDEIIRGELAFAYAGQGRAADAHREAQAALDLAVARNDALRLAVRSADVVRVYLALGDYNRAIAQLRALDRNATLLSRQVLLNHPDFAPLRGRPDFQAVVRTFP
jgi:serine/threonine-protein kinase